MQRNFPPMKTSYHLHDLLFVKLIMEGKLDIVPTRQLTVGRSPAATDCPTVLFIVLSGYAADGAAFCEPIGIIMAYCCLRSRRRWKQKLCKNTANQTTHVRPPTRTGCGFARFVLTPVHKRGQKETRCAAGEQTIFITSTTIKGNSADVINSIISKSLQRSVGMR